ncbi:amidase [Ramlibacter algicola]|uniref:Amidase n=1 Tax=Ramlibacter algicola TaxID=2795217 RepID=A0A934UQ19_9BURK|nr:amidase [Ramlibacter algicola]MBK0392154.1 amidase [Ramlibacter algicola]
MPPRFLLRLLPVLALLACVPAGAQGREAAAEPTVAELQARMATGQLSAEQLTRDGLARIARHDTGPDGLHAVIEVNPDALAIAQERDRERRAGRVRGPLHGIPVLLKDNIDTGDRMLTSAGSLALIDAPAAQDAFLVRRLREAGAVVLGKTNLSEWANIRSGKSSSGWSARGGQTVNPYGPGRNPCGSSSGTGVAIAAGYAPLGVGTETDGSIVCPSSVSGLVGMKPTVGLVSRSGIIPISVSQDTAGPMTRSVADAAVLLNVLAGPDPRDPATVAARIEPDYRAFLKADGLKGMRIGVARKRVTGYSTHADRLFEQALRDLKRLGAELVDPADFGSIGDYDEEELDVLLYELKDGMAKYLATRTGVPVRTLADVIAFNERNADREMAFFGQELFEKAQAKGALTDKAYLDAASKARRLAREGIDKVLQAQRLDAIVAPTTGPAWLTDHVNGDSYGGSSSTPAAVAGYPSITVPMGDAAGLPVGLSFVGTAWTEGKLLQLAHAYEQGTRHRFAPALPASPRRPLMH